MARSQRLKVVDVRALRLKPSQLVVTHKNCRCRLSLAPKSGLGESRHALPPRYADAVIDPPTPTRLVPDFTIQYDQMALAKHFPELTVGQLRQIMVERRVRWKHIRWHGQPLSSDAPGAAQRALLDGAPGTFEVSEPR